jgi:hypothetical protein
VIGLGELKDWLNVTSGTDDALLVLLEKRAVEFVQEVTGRHFGLATAFTEILAGTGDDTLWLNELPASLTSVEERTGVGDTWTALTEGDDDGWELDAPRLWRKKNFTWRLGRQYRVIYTFGYAANAEPGEVRQLVLDLTKLKYDERCSNLAIASEQIGDERYARNAFTSDLKNIPWVGETLDAWRWRRVA